MHTSSANQISISNINLDSFRAKSQKVIAKLLIITLLVLDVPVMPLFGSSNTAEAAALVTPREAWVTVTPRTDASMQNLNIPANAATQGMWSAPFDWPMNGLHNMILPDGKVLTFGTDAVGNNQDGRTFDIWDPNLGFGANSHNTSYQAAQQDSFCATATYLNDGNMLITGGNSGNGGFGRGGLIYNPVNNTRATAQAVTALPRWYSTMVGLPDGRKLVMGGMVPYTEGMYNDPTGAISRGEPSMTPEIYDNGAWRSLVGANSRLAFGPDFLRTSFPHAFVAPNGQVFGISADRMWYLDVNANGGAGAVYDNGQFKPGYGFKADPDNVGALSVAVMYDIGKIIQAGGNGGFNGDGFPASNKATNIDINNGAPVLTELPRMNIPRRYGNGIVLANGEVVITGGTRQGNDGGGNAVYAAEIWNPVANNWRLGANASTIRVYHSINSLLLNGAIIVTGGGTPGPVINKTGEVYYPPYLFEQVGGASRLATRPVIRGISGLKYTNGGTMQMDMDSTAAIRGLSLIALSNGTHSFNNNQRRIPLQFTQEDNRLTATIPNANLTPPGYYQVVALNAQGVPSYANVIAVGAQMAVPQVATTPYDPGAVTPPPPPPPANVPPTVTLTAPATGTAFTQGATVAITATAADSDGSVAFVDFYDGGTLLGSDTSAPYAFNWVTSTATTSGSHSITAVATDNAGARTTSAARAITINAPTGGGGTSTGAYPTGVVGAWKFNEGSGATIADASGNNRPITLTNATWATGISGQAAQFNGVNAFGAVGQSVLDTANNFSVSAWVKLDNLNGWQTFVNQDGVNVSGFWLQYSQFVNGNKFMLSMHDLDSTASAPYRAVSTTTPVVGQWYHIVGVRDKTTNTMKIYVNGQLEGTTAYNGGWAANGSLNLGRGNYGGPNDWVAGSIDGVSVYNRALTDADVAALYQSRDAGVTSNPSGDTDGDGIVDALDLYPNDATRGAGIWREQYNNIGFGITVADLTSAAKFPNAPDVVAKMTTFTSPNDLGDAYGSRIRGIFTAPTTGAYTFWVAGDDETRLNLSTDNTAANKRQIAFVPGWSFANEWTKYPEQRSATINLVAGQHYYLEVLHKEGGGGDGIAVAWQTPSNPTLTVMTDQFFQRAGGTVTPPSGPSPSASSAIVFERRTGASNRVWTVNPDNDSVSVLDAATNRLIREIPVGTSPRTVAIAPNGNIWVANKGSATISVISPTTLSVVQTISLPRASQPHGLIFAPNGDRAYVALEATGQVIKFDPLGNQLAAINIGSNIRHISITADNQTLLVSRFITPALPGEGTAIVNTTNAGAEVVVVNAAGAMTLNRTTILRHSDRADTTITGSGIPNYLGAVAISPDGRTAWVPSKQDNIKRGIARNGQPLNFQNTVRAISSNINMTTLVEDLTRRIDHDNSSVGSAAVYHPSGNHLFVALETSREVAVIDPATGVERFRINVGRAPQGLTISPDGNTLYVQEFMDRSVGMFDLRPLVQQGTLSAPSAGVVFTVTAASEKLPANVVLGKQLFYDAKDPRLSLDSYMSCASCHNDGGHDGRVWDLTGFGEGLRNTISLKGRAAMGHGNLHWSANFDELQDFEGQIRTLAGGRGLMTDAQFNTGTRNQPLGDRKAGVSADLDNLAAYVASLNTFVQSPNRNTDGTLTTAATAGRAVFANSCASCHGGANFTLSSDGSNLRNIGTINALSGQRLGAALAGIDVPTLRDVWATAPYLHNGSAATVTAAVQAHNNLALNATDLANVVAFVQQIGSEEAAVSPSNPTGDTDGDGIVDALDIYPNDASRGEGIWREQYNGIGFGVAVADLTAAAKFPNAPDVVAKMTTFTSPDNIGDAYGSRIRGIFTAPTTGAYTFWVAGDDETRLNLSTDNTAGNKRQIAFVPGWSFSNEWTKYPEQRSVTINLVAGQNYYLEVLHKEGGGGDGVAVAWQTPSNPTRTVMTDQFFQRAGGTPPPPANVAPTVSITAPVSGTAITRGATVSITATAADSDGTVARVEFYDGATLLGTDTTAPYAFSWVTTSSTPTGARNLTARAFDNTGAATTSAAVSVTVNAPTNVAPTVALTAPVVGTAINRGTTVAITATASDSDGTVIRVEFYDGATLLGTDTTAPYAFNWVTTSNTTTGAHSLTARAFDNTGATTTSVAVSVTVNAPIPPANSTRCASENGTCRIPTGRTATVWYGANTSWYVRTGVSVSIGCNNSTFGDPIRGTVKSCRYLAN